MAQTVISPVGGETNVHVSSPLTGAGTSDDPLRLRYYSPDLSIDGGQLSIARGQAYETTDLSSLAGGHGSSSGLLYVQKFTRDLWMVWLYIRLTLSNRSGLYQGYTDFSMDLPSDFPSFRVSHIGNAVSITNHGTIGQVYTDPIFYADASIDKRALKVSVSHASGTTLADSPTDPTFDIFYDGVVRDEDSW